MSIIRVEKRERFVVVDKFGVEDSRLSFKATGLLAYLLSKPKDWSISYRQLAKVKTDGEFRVREGLKELAEHGYLKRHRVQAENGTWGWEQVLYETPQSAETATRAAVIQAREIRALKTPALTEDGLTEEGKTERPSRASRLPENWKPTLEMIEWAADQFPDSDLVLETDKFMDHFAGNGKRMVDWNRTWKNWMRRSEDFSRSRR